VFQALATAATRSDRSPSLLEDQAAFVRMAVPRSMSLSPLVRHSLAATALRSRPGASSSGLACHATIAGAEFFSLALLLSTIFSDLWRPLLIAVGAAIALAFLEQVVRDLPVSGIFEVMSAQEYFRTGKVPWAGLLTIAVASATMLYGAAINFARRDF
jgi:hypothetical protein